MSLISIMQEVTQWSDSNVTNGIYHIDRNGHLVAYQSPDAELKVFSTPMKQFSKTRRKFVKVGSYDN